AIRIAESSLNPGNGRRSKRTRGEGTESSSPQPSFGGSGSSVPKGLDGGIEVGAMPRLLDGAQGAADGGRRDGHQRGGRGAAEIGGGAGVLAPPSGPGRP